MQVKHFVTEYEPVIKQIGEYLICHFEVCLQQ